MPASPPTTALALAAGLLAPGALAQPVTEDALYKAPTPAEYGFFGSFVDIEGDLAIVASSGIGFPGTIIAGTAHLLDLNTGQIVSELIVPPDPASPRQVMGVALLSNGTALVATRQWAFQPTYGNNLYVYDVTDPTTPSLLTFVTPPGATFDNDFGVDIAADGALALVGTPFDDENGSGAGAAYLFDFQTPASPVLRAKIIGDDTAPVDFFGEAVAMHGGLALIGAPRADTPSTNDAGAAYVFDVTDPDNPVQLAKLTAPSQDTNDFFGESLAVSSGVLTVGAFFDDDMGLDAGAVYIYDRANPSGTAPLAKLTNPVGGSGDRFGWKLGADGSTLVVSEVIGDDVDREEGKAFVYDVRTPASPVVGPELLASDASFLNFLGDAVAIEDGTVLLGAEGRENTPQFDGAVYRYDIDPGTPCPTDVTGDEQTDLADLLAVLSAFGVSPSGDVNGDGVTDLADLLAVLAEFGNACP